jgi:hypothetical protein
MKNLINSLIILFVLTSFWSGQDSLAATSKTAKRHLSYNHGYNRYAPSLPDDYYIESAYVDFDYTANTSQEIEGTAGVYIGTQVTVSPGYGFEHDGEGAYWDTPYGCICSSLSDPACVDCLKFDNKPPTTNDKILRIVSDYNTSATTDGVGRVAWTATPYPTMTISGDNSVVSCNNTTKICIVNGSGNGWIKASFSSTDLRLHAQVYALVCRSSDPSCAHVDPDVDWDMRYLNSNGIGFTSSNPPSKNCSSHTTNEDYQFKDYFGLCGKPTLNYSMAYTAFNGTLVNSSDNQRSNQTINIPVTDIYFYVKGIPAPVLGECGTAAGQPTSYPPSGNRCEVGISSSVSECPDSGNWTWTCSSSGAADTPCTAPYSVTDSKVRYYDGGIKKIAGAVGSGSALKIRNTGNTVDLVTWPIDTTCTTLISKIKVKTPAGIRYLGIIP